MPSKNPRKKRPELAQTATIEELPLACSDEAAGVEFFERQRWGDSPCCPECGDTDVYQMKDRKTGKRNKDFRWRCRGCGKLYSVRTGMIFEESLIPMRKWARAVWESATCKNGISALELSRKIQVSYKTALFMMNRLRFAMAQDPDTTPKLSGTVEADETFVGGKPRAHQRGWRKDSLFKPREKWTDKQPVFAVVQRGGEVRTRVIPSVTSANLADALLDMVDPEAKLYTDDNYKYRRVGEKFPGGHEAVNHSIKEYVRGDVHTNTIEGFFSRIKRKINGTHHAVSKKHLHRYVTEAAFLYNNRELNDGERVVALVRNADGKRLRYKEPA
jgi:transposase-like protein